MTSFPDPPYYAVIFTSVKSEDIQDYGEMAERMSKLSAEQPGFLGMEHASGDDLSITICYWNSLESIENWKQNAEHLAAQAEGFKRWYNSFNLRICKVERDKFYKR